MHRICLAAMVCVLACSGDDSSADAAPPDAPDAPTGACEPRGNLEVSVAALDGRAWVRVDGRFLALDGQSAAGRIVRLQGETPISETEIRVHGGKGAAVVDADGGDSLCVQVGVRQRRVQVPVTEIAVSAEIDVGPETRWSGHVRVSNDLLLGADQALVIAPGAVVSMAPGVRVRVEGVLRVEGTMAEPILIAGADTGRFAEWLLVDADANLAHAMISGGGAGDWNFDDDRHCCMPMVRILGGNVVAESLTFVDTPGAKGLLSESANVILRDSLFSNLGHGSEYFVPEGFRLLVQDTVAMELRGPDDSDGLYVWEQGDIVLDRLTVFGADDDGVDSESTNARLLNVVVTDTRDRCLSFTSGSPEVDGALLLRCSVGIKYDVRPDRLVSRPTVARATIADIRSAALFVSARYGGGTPDGDIQPDITRALIGEVGTPLVTDYDPSDVRLTFSVVPEALVGVSEEGLIRASPEFVSPETGDYRLAVDAPGRALGAGYFP